jgi:fatty acid desaturase
MTASTTKRDYSLVGLDGRRAVESGIAGAAWYLCPIPRPDLKELMKRTNGPAIRDTLLWLGLLILFGALGIAAWGTWVAVPFFLGYGVLYGSASDSRWHECGHGTAFKTPWMNIVVYYLASFMIFREPTIWRWSHARHHTDTLIVGRDPEILAQRPPDAIGLALSLFGLKSGAETARKLVVHAAGRLTAEEATFVPETERWKVFAAARVYLAIIASIVVACASMQSLLPAMLLGLPTFYGGFMVTFFGLTQHAGLAEDVLDHRLNSRTVYMNPIFRFLYWNMNYHVEHHMFPTVPYHALPKLHAAIKPNCPPPYRNCWQAYREILPALARQIRDPIYFVRRPVSTEVKTAPGSDGMQVAAAE